MFEICRYDHSYLSQDFLTTVRVVVPACLLGSQWLVSQGTAVTRLLWASLTKKL